MANSPLNSSSSVRGRASRMAPALDPDDRTNLEPSSTASSYPPSRTPPYLPTRTETVLLIALPSILLFGTVFSLLSPQVRNAPFDPVIQAHAQDPHLTPSYFARKSNIFNIIFVKRGWAWVSAAFGVFLATHSSFDGRTDGGLARIRAGLRWGLLTMWWFLVTQWCFGPPIIDRGFRWTGGRCEMVADEIAKEEYVLDVGAAVSALACRTVGGRWSGGHDISGHVFLLVLGIGFLAQEVGWVLHVARGVEERRVIMTDGTERKASVEKSKERQSSDAHLGVGGKVVGAVVALSTWMLLMTAIYFHTWVEKFTGLATAVTALYTVYLVPRFVPAIRTVVGLPGI